MPCEPCGKASRYRDGFNLAFDRRTRKQRDPWHRVCVRDKANCFCFYPNKACAGQRQCHKHGHGFHGEKCDEASNAPGSNSARVFSKLKRNSSPTLTDPAYRVTMAGDGQAQSWSESYALQPPSTPPISGDSERNDGEGWSGSKLVRELRSPTTFNPAHKW